MSFGILSHAVLSSRFKLLVHFTPTCNMQKHAHINLKFVPISQINLNLKVWYSYVTVTVSAPGACCGPCCWQGQSQWPSDVHVHCPSAKSPVQNFHIYAKYRPYINCIFRKLASWDTSLFGELQSNKNEYLQYENLKPEPLKPWCHGGIPSILHWALSDAAAVTIS